MCIKMKKEKSELELRIEDLENDNRRLYNDYQELRREYKLLEEQDEENCIEISGLYDGISDLCKRLREAKEETEKRREYALELKKEVEKLKK